MRKLLAVFVLGCLLLMSIPIPVFASDGDKYPDVKRVSLYSDEEIAKMDQLIITGVISRPPGPELAVKTLAPGEVNLPVNVPQSHTPSPKMTTLGAISAGFQMFGGSWGDPAKPNRGGIVAGETYSVPFLVDNWHEYQVIHQWGLLGTANQENAITFLRSGTTANILLSYAQWGGTRYQIDYPASHTIRAYLLPQNSSGSYTYNSIQYTIWDLTSGQSTSRVVTLPQTESINTVDAALEQDISYPPNGLVLQFSNFLVCDYPANYINLQTNFRWIDNAFPTYMHNTHSETYFSSYTRATLYQAKTTP